MYNRITASFERSPDDPLSRKKLFDDTDFQTHKSTFQTCIQPSTIADLYSAIASLIKESDSNTAKLIKESEERQLSSFRAELSKIREEMKVEDRPAKKSTEDNSGTSKQKNDKVYEEDLNGEILCKLVEKSDVQGDDASNWKMENSDDAHKHSSDPVTDALADSKMVEVNLKRRWDILMEEMDSVRAIQEVEMSEQEKGNEGKALCTGEKGIGKNGKPLHYKGTTFHRVIPRSMFIGEDITEGNGLGGESIYGDSFADENFVNKHIGPGILSMANTSPGTNNSQFLILTAKTEWLDGTNVVFSIVVEGFDVIKVV
ncbi:hypothetical protein EZV62_018362 [Acer yangbiense]|uniref:PPIase cyclophilin-type domain-containing protein n=1 Tax=Acer yangbiense TaxID=1000413 RepID=A0A5C7HJT3_9ROSI|nr:hypothetical protein EZV62_018362 [Acer yangbiense]